MRVLGRMTSDMLDPDLGRRLAMILGIAVTGTVMLVGGALMFALVLFEVLLGLRVIKLGKRHRMVHRWTAYAILGVGAVHGLLGVLFVTGAVLG
jgi:hypothetical protein